MSQVFPPGANWLVRWIIVGGGVSLAVFVGMATALYWSPLVTRVNIYRPQPIPFSHARHVQGNGIDCRYCHTTVETAAFAGIPPTETCMTCHSQVFNDQPILEAARESWRTGMPMEWVRVYDLPDFVYFNHSIHVRQGIGCSTCHGRIDEMPLTLKANPLRMMWCLQCHGAPEKFIRPREEVFNMAWESPANQWEMGSKLVEDYGIEVEQLKNCSICHR